MKLLSKSWAVMLLLGVFLFGCQPDNVNPKLENGSDAASFVADDTDPHPLPDPVCSRFDTIQLATAALGLKVDYCGSFNNTSLPCPPNMPDWGFVEVLNGRELLLMNFSLAIGWFADLNRSSIGLASNFQLDQNGIPTSSNDWQSINIAPVVNKWQLLYELDSLPSPCFDVALQLQVVKLNFFSGIDPNSGVNLWGYNGDWNNPGDPDMNTISAFLTPWCPSICPGDLPDPDSICTVAYPNLPQNAGCAVLDPAPYITATGPLMYEWSTAESTPTITVCPSATSEYSVTVMDGSNAINVTHFTVNAQNIICTPGNRPTQKVLVCHIPPGNPNNPQTICIDWSGVPAHVEAYRTPQMNPNHGHDSGCHLGPCNSDPCANN